jgi:hypothetical protein
MKQIYIFQNSTKYLDGNRVKVNNRTCIICGDKFRYDTRTHWLIYKDNNSCFDCQYWYEKWLMQDELSVIRVSGEHYLISTEPGLTAHIIRDDGTEIVTTNLWHQGKIPEVWIGLGLTDNARFVK